jgi:hypothetical protein
MAHEFKERGGGATDREEIISWMMISPFILLQVFAICRLLMIHSPPLTGGEGPRTPKKSMLPSGFQRFSIHGSGGIVSKDQRLEPLSIDPLSDQPEAFAVGVNLISLLIGL